MHTWFPYIRGFHIVCGMIAFFVAPIAMLTAKGGRAHRRWGSAYFWSMALVAISALAMALSRPTVFLALVSLFTFYFAFGGYRAVKRKNQPPSLIDWIAPAITLAGSLGLIAIAIHPLPHQFLPSPTVSLIFGLVGSSFATRDLRALFKPSKHKMAWWFAHMAGMLASYIAAMAAFSAVNFKFLPITIRWTWPIFLGVPCIFLWTNYYRRKFSATSSRQPVAADASSLD
jgi:hypothetical protein